MRILVDARYARHLKSVLILEVAKIGQDKVYRDGTEDPRILAWAPISDERIDADATGELLIVIDEPEQASADVIPMPPPSPLRAAS